MPDLASLRDVIAARGCRLGGALHLLAETESTNDDAKREAKNGAPHGAVWLAESQSKGRGRQGRVWSSPAGENLLFSVLLRIQCPPPSVPPIALAAGLAVRDAVAAALGEDDRVLVKWPNDVVIRTSRGPRDRDSDRDRVSAGAAPEAFRKVAGILVESSLLGKSIEHVIVGIGINVHTRAFPAELEPIATSIAIERAVSPSATTPPLDRAAIVADVLARLDHDVEHVAHRGLGLVHGRLTKYDALVGRSVIQELDGKDVVVTAAGIDDGGRLLVRDAAGIVRSVAAGEVRLAR